MPPVSTTSKDLPFQVTLPYMRSRVMPGSSVTSARRGPMIRLKRVDLPTFGRPTMAISGRGEFMKGSNGIFGCRISDVGFGERLIARRADRNPNLVPLSFWKIAHQRIWDLKCLQVIYSQVTET